MSNDTNLQSIKNFILKKQEDEKYKKFQTNLNSYRVLPLINHDHIMKAELNDDIINTSITLTSNLDLDTFDQRHKNAAISNLPRNYEKVKNSMNKKLYTFINEQKSSFVIAK